ncbi:MAG: DNA replication/repair protein RecF [Ardenticatenales bacterium]|nr:DNA replication/repair protein RecF [Ardenticatenales bacterium]
MHLQALRLLNFRNYVRLEGSFEPGITILFGANAQGKTNFLESLYYLSNAAASHARSDRQLIHFDVSEDVIPFARVEATIKRRDGAQQVALTIGLQNGRLQKRIELNGIAKRVHEYVGEINAVLFLPEDIDLIASGPSLRRRYLDTTISQIDQSYYRALAEYEEVLGQRNAQLKALAERGLRNSEELLAFWDEKLVEAGAYIILRRQQVIARLDELAGRIHPELTGYNEFLRLSYLPRLELGYHASHQLSLDVGTDLLREGTLLTLQEVQERFHESLQRRRAEELARAVTVVGPHRDDVRFLVNEVDMTDYGSRGQQRTSALTLKLSEVALITEKRGDPPILLLDDVMSELDEARRRYMTEMLIEYPQVFLTTTDLDVFTEPFLGRARLLHVEQGRHREVDQAQKKRADS